MDKLVKIFKFVILPIYWAFLTYMLLKEGQEDSMQLFENYLHLDHMDKYIHIAVFMCLGGCFTLSFLETSFLVFIQIMLSYSLLTEILQDEMKLGRSMEFLDIVANLTGVSLGYVLVKAAHQQMFKNKNTI